MAASETIHLGPILYCERSTKLLFPGVHGTQAQDQSTLLMPGPASLAHLAAVTLPLRMPLLEKSINP